MKAAPLLLCLLPAFAATTIATTADEPAAAALRDRVDAYLAPLAAHHALSGAILIARDGETVLEEYSGDRDFAKRDPNDATTSFAIASITKTFTAAAIERLLLDGKVALSDPLARFIPAFPNGTNISIAMLLAHTAGLADPDYADLLQRPSTLDDAVASIAAQKPLFAPGTAERYSNAGYVALAKVIEVASGGAYADYLRTTFFAKLGLGQTFADDGRRTRPQTAIPYIPAAPPAYVEAVPAQNVAAFTGSGILMSSARDLQVWAQAVAAGTIVPLRSFTYPFGWGVRHYFDDDVIEQSGDLNGVVSYVAYYKKARVTVVHLSNVEVGPNERIGKALGALALGHAVDPIVWPQTAATSIPAGVEGEYVGNVGTFGVTMRDGNLYARWKAAQLAQYLQPVAGGKYYVPVDGSVIDFTRIDGNMRATRRWESNAATFTQTPP